MIKILFVCHGNICRSTMAEYVMKYLVNQNGLEDKFFIDSAGTSTEEIGNPVHYGTRRKLESVNIPDSVVKMEHRAFAYCPNLKSVVISNSIKTIDLFTFAGCKNLKSAVIPNGIEEIKKMAFGDCVNLETITIPKTVKIIEEAVFENCEKLTIHAPTGSYAEQYAKENNIPFVAE